MDALVTSAISKDDRVLLAHAKKTLEEISLAAKISNYIGQPIDKLVRKLPAQSGDAILAASEKALQASLKAAMYTLRAEPQPASNTMHKLGAATSGAVGGAFGLSALAIELPISTTIMLRSVADIARSHGEDLSSPQCQLACLEVFALGGPGEQDDATEGGYFAVRAALATTVSDAATYLATYKAITEGAPLLVKLVKQIAARFSIPVTGKVAAQAVPVIGGVGGGIINTLFIDHFQHMATGHFLVRKLERKYGEEVISAEYKKIRPDADKFL